MGTKIIETGSTAGGIAKVEYKDESNNVLWYYDDAGNFVRNGNVKAGSFSVSTATGTVGEVRATIAGMSIGTLTAKDVIIGTGGSARITVAGDGSKTIFGTTIMVNTGAGENLALGTSGGAGLVSIKNASTVENIRLDGSTGIIKGQFQLSALSTPPASATATGTLGEIRIDANYIYVCTATNTWKRTALSTW